MKMSRQEKQPIPILGNEQFSELRPNAQEVHVAGRIQAIREMGTTAFIDIGIGEDDRLLQLVISDKTSISEFKIGDIIDAQGVTGETALSKKRNLDQVSVYADQLGLLSRQEQSAWLEKDHKMKRKREAEYSQTVISRNTMFAEIRRKMDSAGFVQVDTSVLQDSPSGASARSFETYSNSQAETKHLRIAQEVDLKLVMALSGIEKVYEIGKNFRNEGLSPAHSPEFTSIEAYSAYSTPESAKETSIELLGIIATTNSGVNPFDRRKITQRNYPEIMETNISEFDFDQDFYGIEPEDRHAVLLKKVNEIYGKNAEEQVKNKSYPGILDWMYKQSVVKKLIEPVVVVGYPIEMMPLAESLPDNSGVANAFQIVYKQREIVKAYAEDVNPQSLKAKLSSQSNKGKESVVTDQRLIEAARAGLPPMTGLGVGIDRVVSLVKDVPIHDILPVPIKTPPYRKF